MAISRTYGQLQNQIADEMGDRQDLLLPLSDSADSQSPIVNAIQSAIALWEREAFYFLEFYDQGQISTKVGQEFYTAADDPKIGTMPYIDQARVLINNNRYTLTRRSWEYLEEISVNPAVLGWPIDFAYKAQTLRIYQVPEMIYPLTFMCNERLATLAATGDANAWTQDGYDLIRCQARMILANEVIHDTDMVTAMKLAIYGDPKSQFINQQNQGYLFALRGETNRRDRGGRIRPTSF